MRIELTVPESRRDEIDLAWREIVAGRRPRMDALNHEIAAITERAMIALRVIENAILRNPSTGQARRLVSFLAALYNGSELPFDLTELRALDTEIANACLDYLNYDRLARREVRRHLSAGERELHRLIDGIGPRSGGTEQSSPRTRKARDWASGPGQGRVTPDLQRPAVPSAPGGGT
ncbi:MAG: DUF7673 family protein [Acetobacteraceae bacterium]